MNFHLFTHFPLFKAIYYRVNGFSSIKVTDFRAKTLDHYITRNCITQNLQKIQNKSPQMGTKTAIIAKTGITIS
jgi:c-di-AMP phosphodiesterase-like protein